MNEADTQYCVGEGQYMFFFRNIKILSDLRGGGLDRREELAHKFFVKARVNDAYLLYIILRYITYLNFQTIAFLYSIVI